MKAHADGGGAGIHGTHDLSAWRHEHRFDDGNAAGERGARAVAWLTLGTMGVEIAAGLWANSMALLADGLHMSSHALAIGLAAYAYAAARKHARDPRFAFGSWKIEVLASFASALVLLGMAALMVVGSLQRLWAPEAIHYPQAMAVAALGLAVNLVSALLLHGGHAGDGGGHGHGHAHEHDHGHGHAHHDHHDHVHHEDLNLRSAYLHVLADAGTSVLALVALAGGWWWGWAWLDPAMGLLGAVLVANWARGLLRETAVVLLDREMDHPLAAAIRDAVQQAGRDADTHVTDLHLWRVGKGRFACALSLLTHDPTLQPATVRAWLAPQQALVHATIEIAQCPQCPGAAVAAG